MARTPTSLSFSEALFNECAMTGEFMANDVTPALICHAQLLLRYAKQWELEVNGRTWAERFVLLRKRRYSAIKSISTNGVEE